MTVVIIMVEETNRSAWYRQKLHQFGLRQEDLARISGISRSFLNQIINGRRLPSKRTAKAIAKALEVPEVWPELL